MQRHTITLDHPTDWPGFRTAARALLQANVPPQAVDWRCQADAANDLFAPEPYSQALPNPTPHAPTLPFSQTIGVTPRLSIATSNSR